MPGSTTRSRKRGIKGNGTAWGTNGIDRGGGERTRNGERGVGRRRGGKRRGEEKSNHWWGALKSTGGSTKDEVPIRFSTNNIRNGRNGVLESAIREMSQANIDLGILQETKYTDGIYTCESAGYRVVATDAPSQHREKW